ncbi:MAG: hypothetical protein NDJ75_05860 [Thermoanaerobaculia bacterium]|nr:hypothetical protein [Thermoanaerobaculia bacterium]
MPASGVTWPHAAGADSAAEGALAAHPLQIASWSELRAHLESAGKRDAYGKLLAEFGVDAGAAEVAGLGDRPAILFAEQPGCWFTPRDLVRARLLERLIGRGGFDAERSGVRTLVHDRFTGDGEKSVFLDFHLHPGLGPARLLGAQFLKKFEHRTYASLHITAMSHQRMRAVWDYSLQMLEAASISRARFVEVVAGIFAAGPVAGARDILPASNDREDLLRLADDLAACRPEPAFKALWPARTHLRREIAWDAYWNAVNSDFLGLPIESLSPLMGRFLLAVDDPVKLGRHLHERIGAAPGEPVSVAGVVADDEIFRTVLFDPSRETFFAVGRDGSRRTIAWEALRASAADSRGARPSGVLEYLFLAAFGYYLLVDCGDSIQPFHEAVCDIHRDATGLKFPWTSFAVHGVLGEQGNRFTDVFRPGFVELTVDVMGRFFEH